MSPLSKLKRVNVPDRLGRLQFSSLVFESLNSFPAIVSVSMLSLNLSVGEGSARSVSVIDTAAGDNVIDIVSNALA